MQPLYKLAVILAFSIAVTKALKQGNKEYSHMQVPLFTEPYVAIPIQVYMHACSYIASYIRII